MPSAHTYTDVNYKNGELKSESCQLGIKSGRTAVELCINTASSLHPHSSSAAPAVLFASSSSTWQPCSHSGCTTDLHTGLSPWRGNAERN
ncbi:hypothetical protein LDENG_00006400 [Lucifuga dentata]|nr:hypothetical protein LDENG_00006400 [Lucifuga dentata]